MTTASHTMIARTVGHDQERQGFRIMSTGAVALALVVVALAISQMMPPRALVDATHEAQ